MGFIQFISSRLPVLIIADAVCTYFSPVYLRAASWVPSVLLGIVILFTGLSMDVGALKKIHLKKQELTIVTILKWTITVLISIGLARLFFSSKPEMAAGLILSGTVPSATAATVYTFLAGGNTSLVITASLLDVILSPVITPFSLAGIFSGKVAISFAALLKSFLLIVVLPLGIGILLQRLFPRTAGISKDVTKLGSSLSLLLIVHTIVGSGKEAVSSEITLLPVMAFATLIQVLFPMAAAYFIAKRKGMDEEDARAALFQVGLCNTALAAILAFKFIGETATIAPILNMIFNLSLGAFIANRFNKTKPKDAFKWSGHRKSDFKEAGEGPL